MLLEALLAYLHLGAVLAVVVFVTSQAALLRREWLNAEVVARLNRVQRIYLVTLLAVLLTGLARTAWGFKGWSWYWQQPLLWLKVGGLGLLATAAFPPGRAYGRWALQLQRDGSLPSPEQVTRVRRIVMRAAHGMLVLPALGALLARGIFTR